MKGHIRERGAGHWYAVLDERDPATGKRKRKWHKLDATTKRKAQDASADLISGKKNGTYVAPDKTMLTEFLERWLTNIKPNVAPRTHERYAEIVRKNRSVARGRHALQASAGHHHRGLCQGPVGRYDGQRPPLPSLRGPHAPGRSAPSAGNVCTEILKIRSSSPPRSRSAC
jgi:hypothetical protein